MLDLVAIVVQAAENGLVRRLAITDTKSCSLFLPVTRLHRNTREHNKHHSNHHSNHIKTHMDTFNIISAPTTNPALALVAVHIVIASVLARAHTEISSAVAPMSLVRLGMFRSEKVFRGWDLACLENFFSHSILDDKLDGKQTFYKATLIPSRTIGLYKRPT